MNHTQILVDVPTIALNSVTLRKLRATDAAALFRYYHNPSVYQHLDWYGPSSTEDAEALIARWNRGFEEGWILRFAIADTSTDEIIGTIFLNGFEGKRAEVGYELSESCWNQGIMSEALQGIVELGFNRLGRQRIQACVSHENRASQRLLLKNGFEQEGVLRKYECHEVSGELKDMILYSIVRGGHSENPARADAFSFCDALSAPDPDKPDDLQDLGEAPPS